MMSTIYKMLPSFAHVVRDGSMVEVPVSQLVVGDIVELNIGDKIPADVRLLRVDQMKVKGEKKSNFILPIIIGG